MKAAASNDETVLSTFHMLTIDDAAAYVLYRFNFPRESVVERWHREIVESIVESMSVLVSSRSAVFLADGTRRLD